MRMFLVLYIGLWCMISTAENYYVDNVAGKDSFDGKSNTVRDNTGPFATIARALKAAGAGDTVHLNPTGSLYREGVDFNKHKGGEPGRPLVFDGHGATVSGAIPCTSNGWKVWKGGVLQRDDMRSWGFLLVDGEMVFELQTIDSLQPGEFCILPQMPIHFFPPKEKKLDELLIEVDQPDGTTLKLEPSKWQRSNSKIQQVLRYPGLNKVTRMKIDGNPAPMLSAKERLQPGQWCGEGKCMYYYPPAGKSVESLSIECAVVTNALSLNGETAWVTVQNLNVRHPNDDGYNLHGHVTHVEFINCNAFQCGDQGFSAHDQCESVVDGAVYEQCSQGVANVNGGGFSITRNAIIRNCRGPAFLIQGAARHELTDSILIDNSAPAQVAIEGASQFKANNVLMVNTSSSKLLGGTGISVNCKTSLSRITSA
ncbi:MAG: hypothetical protein WCP55_25845, partial [Lentisphaerota bacterium]